MWKDKCLLKAIKVVSEFKHYNEIPATLRYKEKALAPGMSFT